MVLALIFIPLAGILGYILHRVRIRTLERELERSFAGRLRVHRPLRAVVESRTGEIKAPATVEGSRIDRAPSELIVPELVAPPAEHPKISESTDSMSGDGYGGVAQEVMTVSQNQADKKTTVLIVDDHPGTCAYLSYALRKHHRVIEATNGEEALEIVKDIDPDLVVSDIMMPVMDGNELCRSIKSNASLNHVPVFLVTASAVPTLKHEGLESGADDYLVKPFDLKEAVIRINNAIKMRSELRRRFSREVVIKPTDIKVTSAEEAFLIRAREIVEEHIDDGNFSVQDLASEFALSSRQLQRRLRETVDQSPVEFIRTLRLHRAAQLLAGNFGNVSEVAYSVGFTSLSYFAKCFREQFGSSPSEFKARQAA